MNVDHILRTFGDCGVEYLLIGGMNFLLRHEPVLTYDIDFWIRDSAENRDRCDIALRRLDAAWGATEQDWRPVATQPGWLVRQPVFCLTSPSGAIDIFRTVAGLHSWEECNARAHAGRTAGGAPYRGLCDEDMLACQLALPPGQRRQSRVEALHRIAGRVGRPDDTIT
ncbi:MAG: hypothetical protein K8S94_04395 [Planctomycetia bacterium]|nr:hypothetical protein [Planctomycetia bacterium]